MNFRFDTMFFPGGKSKAFTLSYDDASFQDERFIELVNKYNLKGTFNLNSGTLIEDNAAKIDRIKKSNVKKLYKGQEVAVHTLTHPSLVLLPENVISYEVSSDRFNLEQLVEYPVRGMAYPYGTYNEKVISVLEKCGIEYSRTVNSTHSFDIPENFLTWHPTCHHSDERLIELADRFLSDKYLYRVEPKLFYVWGHSYEFDNDNGWDTIENLFCKISNLDSVWYATNIEIVDYVNAVKGLKYSSDRSIIYNPSSIDVWLNINDKVYKIGKGETIKIM